MNLTKRRVARIVNGLVLLQALLPAASLASGYEYFPGVHFNTTAPEFDIQPAPFHVHCWAECYGRPSDVSVNDPYGIQFEERRANAQLIAKARKLEGTGRYREAARVYLKALPDSGSDRASLQDRIEVLRQITPESNQRCLRLYLRARDLYDGGNLQEAHGLMQGIRANAQAGFLRAHSDYALAGLEYDWGHYRRAARLYEKCAADCPASPRREAALYMVASSLLRSAGKDPYTWIDTPLPTRESVRRSRAALLELLTRYPRTRFRAGAFGWLGRCEYVQKRYPEAMRLYLKQIDATADTVQKVKAIASIEFTRERMTAEDAGRFGAKLRGEPELLVPYLEYCLYHRGSVYIPWAGPERRAALKQRRGARLRLAALAESIIRSNPRLKIPDVLGSRLAEAHYRAGNFRTSVRWADRTLQRRRREADPASRSLAHYIRGSARRKLGSLRGAIADFQALLRDYPKSYLAAAAREILAIAYEDNGELGRALEQYFVLNYNHDVAFLLDARMSIAQVKAFLAAYPRHSHRQLITYSLAIRYLRADRLEDASHALSTVNPRRLSEFWNPNVEQWSGPGEPLYDPRVTIADLRRLRREVAQARGREPKARAMFNLAAYYYKHRDLLLYNAALWNFSRSNLFSIGWNENHATREDDAAARAHHYEHECVNRAREICLEIVKKYPRTSIAPRALYRAACCARRMASFNNWWREEDQRAKLWDQSIRLMNELVTKYPSHPLAKPARKYARVFAAEKHGQFY